MSNIAILLTTLAIFLIIPSIIMGGYVIWQSYMAVKRHREMSAYMKSDEVTKTRRWMRDMDL